MYSVSMSFYFGLLDGLVSSPLLHTLCEKIHIGHEPFEWNWRMVDLIFVWVLHIGNEYLLNSPMNIVLLALRIQ